MKENKLNPNKNLTLNSENTKFKTIILLTFIFTKIPIYYLSIKHIHFPVAESVNIISAKK